MMRTWNLWTLLAFIPLISAIELTFELPDNANQCFYEEIKAGVDIVVEYQVCYPSLYVRIN
jgi:protein ERP2